MFPSAGRRDTARRDSDTSRRRFPSRAHYFGTSASLSAEAAATVSLDLLPRPRATARYALLLTATESVNIPPFAGPASDTEGVPTSRSGGAPCGEAKGKT